METHPLCCSVSDLCSCLVSLLAASEAPTYGYVPPLSGYAVSPTQNVAWSGGLPSSGLTPGKSVSDLVYILEKEAGLGVNGRDIYS